MPKQISVVSSSKDTYKDKFVTNQLGEAQINPTLSSKMRKQLVYVFCTYKNEFTSDKQPSSAIIGNEVDIVLNIDRPYPPVTGIPA
ncbi:hypothetical protein O181_063911 [Austropuccinia psidii MF-1]|uniref:Uncharacterized protein n=1 Tax=Austropuccinia psidii MF-1 TaxID=1389203 RepID=A0A9Q3ESN8_9BASI|nr:hypothetical protein [Austropuccinia psidii MF-1]